MVKITVRCCHDCYMYLNPFALRVAIQGSHRLEKYLNIEGILEKSLKIKTAVRDLNQYKIVVPLFGAANVATNKGTTILY